MDYRENLKKGKKFGQGQSREGGGRPKKVQNLIKEMFKDNGHTLSDNQIRVILREFVSLTEAEIKQKLIDPDVPFAVKLGYKLMTEQSKKGSADLFKWLFEIHIGKPSQSIQSEVKIDGAQLPDWLKLKDID